MNIPDVLRAMPLKVPVKARKISNQETMRKSLEGFDEVGLVNETNGFGLDFCS